jgi:hypothetical protein
MMMSARRKVAPGSGKRRDVVSWADVNFTKIKNKKIMRSIQLLQIDDEDLKQ